MAKINPVKLRQDADAAERAGRLDKAIEALKQVVQENPRDWNTVNRIGDLHAKLNNVKAANEQYVKVARYFAEDGFYLKAIAVWKKVLRNDASLLDGHISLGDLYAKQGLTAEAKQTFALVYDEYVKRNKLRDAGEVLRRMADVDPSDLKVRIRLAELYGREGDPEKAAGEFLTIADELMKKGLLAEALQLLDKALRGTKRSPRLVAACARVHLVQKDFARAVELFQEARRSSPGDRELLLRLAEAAVGARRPDEARAALEEVLQRDPGDEEARQQIGLVFLAEGRLDEAYNHVAAAADRLVERRQLDRAANLLQQIVQRDPRHAPTLTKLVEVYRQARNDQLTAQTYSQLVDAYVGAGAMDRAATVMEMLVQLEPHNEQHRSKLRWLQEQVDGGGTPFEMDLQAAPAVVSPAPASRPALAPAAAPPPRGLELSGPLSGEDQEFINEHLAEGRVFRKYGLAEKARDQLEAVLSRFPDQLEALRELADLQRERGDAAAAARHLRVLAEVHRLKGDQGLAARVEAEAADLVPGAAPAPVPAPKPAAGPPSAAPAVAARPAAPAPTPSAPALRPSAVPPPADLGLDITVEEPALETEAAEPPDELDYVDLESIPSEPEKPSTSFDLSDFAPGGEIGGQFLDEDELAPAAEDEGFDLGEAEEPPAAPEPTRAKAKPAPKAAKPTPTRARPEPARSTPAPAPRPAAAPAPKAKPPAAPRPASAPAPTAQLRPRAAPPTQPPSGIPSELRRAVEEIESYVSMGFVEDARGVLNEASLRFPKHPALKKWLAELGLDAPPAPARVPVRAAETSAFDDLDLGPAPAEPSAPVVADEPLQLGADLFDLGASPPAAHSLEDLAVGPPDGEPESEPEAEPQGFDLASELGDLFGAQAAVAEEPAASGTDLGDKALADIFREFQKGVDKQLGKEDYETRYNLGIAYKEMGLVDEAIGEFQLAAKDERRLLECASMLGICFLEKGMPKLAVKWFEKGLAAAGRTDEEYQGLRYDLAAALEQAGEEGRALAVFSELYGQDASFRDVADRVRRLSVH